MNLLNLIECPLKTKKLYIIQYYQKLNKNFGRMAQQNQPIQINISKNKTQNSTKWTTEEEEKLYELYMLYGSSWKNFTTIIKTKSQSSIKNSFYNKIKKFSRKLIDFQKMHMKSYRTFITHQNILKFLEIGALLMKWIAENKCTKNKESKIFINRNKIIQLSFFSKKEFEVEQTRKIVVDLKNIIQYVRCFGIFKNNLKKCWRFNEQRLHFIQQFDQVNIEKQLNVKKYDKETYGEQSNSSKSEFKQNFMTPLQFQQLQSLDYDEQNRLIKIFAPNSFEKLGDDLSYS